MRTEAIYGNLPKDLGLIDLDPVEMMAWLYLPIRIPGIDSFVIPPNLRQFSPIIYTAFEDAGCPDSYVYVTAKTLWVNSTIPPNRPGWHSDGFGSNDLNYVWCDRAPTVFWSSLNRVSFSRDHQISLDEMDDIAEPDIHNHVRFPLKHLLRLDETVIHKVDSNMSDGWRTFVKISISDHKYQLAGNSINHELPLYGNYAQRSTTRNDPITEKQNETR